VSERRALRATRPPSKSAFRVEAVAVHAPIIDGAVAERRLLGIHDSLASARARLRSARLWSHLESMDTVWLPIVHITHETMNAGSRGYRGRLWLSRRGDILDRLSVDDEIASWTGRAPSACRWRPGDIAAAEHEGRYRIGVVLAQPHTPQWMKTQARPGVTRADDVYLLGFAGTAREHCHPREAQMFEPLGHVSPTLRKRLVARLEAYEGGASFRRRAAHPGR
jgi:hypothetical protein